jgi:hypothetical protein
MNKTISTTLKLAIFVGFAMIFMVALIALSAFQKTTHDPIIRLSDFSYNDTKKIEKKFTVQSGDRLIVNTDVGNVSVTGTNSNEINIIVKAHGSEEYLDAYDLTFDQRGNTVSVEGRLEKKYRHIFDSWSMDVEFEITVPTNFNIEIETAGGNLSVDNVKGMINGSTSGGNIDIDSIDGTVKLSTSGGNLGIYNSKGELELETSGGNIKGESITGTLNVETSGGNIILRETLGKIYATTSGGDIRVDVKENKGVSLRTSGGNIVLRVPKSLAATIEAETSAGDVNCELDFSGKIKEGRMNGKINGGGNIVHLETSGGDIDIVSLD